MLIVGIKLKPGVDGERLQAFIDKWVPDLEKSTRIGALTSLKLYSSSVADTRVDEFVLTIDGFVDGPPLVRLEELCDVVYGLQCEETGSWPKDSATH
jgi:hypothetical protein